MDLTSATKTSTVTGFSNSLLTNPYSSLALDHLLFYYIICFVVKNQQLRTRPVYLSCIYDVLFLTEYIL